MDGDQVARADVQVMLTRSDLVVLPFRGEDDNEVVLGILVHLRPLVLVADVFDRQGMELESLFQELVVIVIGRFNVQPQALGGADRKRSRDVGIIARQAAPVGGDQRPHVRAA